jgi:hypothetical protein
LFGGSKKGTKMGRIFGTPRRFGARQEKFGVDDEVGSISI